MSKIKTNVSRALLAGLASACAMLFSAGSAAQNWPDKPVTFIVPFPPGGPVDTTARLTTQPMAQSWNVPAVIENKAGAGGIVGAQAAAKAPADGNHYFFAAIHHAVLPSLKKSLPYDIQKDFVPVGFAARFPIVLVVHPSLPVKSVAELIAYAKANPNKLSYSSAGTGGGTHLAGELFNSMAGTTMQHVPYKGSSPAMQDLVAVKCSSCLRMAPLRCHSSSQAKFAPLAWATPHPPLFFPDVPTIASAGLPGYEAYSWTGVVAPKGTPPEAVKRMNADLVKVLKDPKTAEALMKAGAEPVAMSPEEFGKFLQNEITKWNETIKKAGIQAD